MRADPRPRYFVNTIFVCLLASGTIGCDSVMQILMSPDELPEGQRGLSLSDLPPGAVAVVAQGLEVPWGIAFLPDGGFLVTERPGRVMRFPMWTEGDEPLSPDDAQVWSVEGVRESGEAGLMGVAVHPAYRANDLSGTAQPVPTSAQNQWVYFMFTSDGPGGLQNRIVRFQLTAQGLTDPQVIIAGIPGNRFHDGGRVAFGPDGYLYVTAGDAGDPARSQAPTSLGGKILRIDDSGAIPPTNPFGSAVWSLGHRNPQGVAWDAEGRLWSTEHGRSGLQSGFDELNLIRDGENYGWPIVQGDDEVVPYRSPAMHSGEAHTWAPSGIASIGGRLFFGGLRGEALFEVAIEGESVSGLVGHFASELGRIRSVVAGPDGMLYFTTSNRDGRGARRDGDDKVLRVDPVLLRR